MESTTSYTFPVQTGGIFYFEVSMCPARRTVNGKSICPASVNHVSYRVRSRGFS